MTGTAAAGGNHPPTVTRRRNEKISQAVAREILHEMTRLGLGEGDMLPAEAEMLETYDVGRASLREALRILEIQGLIVIKPGPGGGPIVAGVHSSDFGRMATMYFHMAGATFRELVDARLVLEPVMAGVAAKRQDARYIQQLEQCLTNARTSPPEDVPAYTRSALDFHSLIAGMSGNRVLDLTGRAMKDIYSDRIREMIFPEDERSKLIEAHDLIGRAIIDGNADKAERLMREHMEEFTHYVETRFPGMLDEVVTWV
jgi:GntR family transcriptional regulator, transcriptional repressor for pyruvate dehydrogenase complex